MRSIRARFTFLTSFAVIISVLATIIIVSFSLTKYISDRSDDVLRLVCHDKQEALDHYFNSIEQSVDTVADYAEQDIASSSNITSHIRRTERFFSTVASNTRGTLTFYYRVDPVIAGGDVGFWYQKKGHDGSHFLKSALTEIGKYDPDNISRVGWFYIPKRTGEPVWIEPYNNDNMGVKMISYVVPVYKDGEFFGVVGIDFSYTSLVANMEVVDEFETGYAFLTNSEGDIIYHKALESGTPLEGKVPDELIASSGDDNSGIIRYKYGGIRKRAASTELRNDMRLFVTVDEAEITSGWKNLISIIAASAIALLALFILITFFLVRRVTKPLSDLTAAAAAFDAGDYDVELTYDKDDEIGILTNAFRQMRDHVKAQIGNLNTMAFKDALTSIRNKAAMDVFTKVIDDKIASGSDDDRPEFAICMLDCNDLKEINDTYGHDKGDLYLKTACKLICDVFRHSAVFRAGGDEFVAIMQNSDYEMREELCRIFDRRTAATLEADLEPWERVSIAKGLAVYDPDSDTCTADVLKRADEQMYENKKTMKESM